MIIVKLWGGIGNQLFQYVFGLYLHYHYDSMISFDNNTLVKIDKLRKLEIEAIDSGIKFDNHFIFSRYRGIKGALLRWLFQLHPKHHFIKEGDILPSKIKSTHIYYVQGYWQDVSYYNWLRLNVEGFKIQSIFFPPELQCLRDQVLSSPFSVSIHVRRGDYFSPQFIDTYGVCDKAYYEKALSIIRKEEKNISVYVFSDDLDWVKSNLNLGNNVKYIPNYNISQFAYIELMSLCKHHIISNSSFSWWGAVLNEKEESIVICPKRWTLKSEKSLALDYWKKI